MKKALFLFFVCLSSIISIKAQSENFYVYGVDFSQVKVYAADESIEQFAEAFNGINMLLITEPQKYDFTKMLDTRLSVDVEMMINKLASSRFSNMKIFGTAYPELDCAQIIQEYNLQQSEGTGVVLIAEFLNKVTAEATYELVLFDINSRTIQYKKEVVGKARGFGLRNFWAGSVYEILQKEKIPNIKVQRVQSPSNNQYRIEVIEKQQEVEPIQVYNALKSHGYRGFVDGGFTIGYDFVIEANTSHGFQVNPYFFVGGGMGLHIYSIEGLVNIPIFANVRANLLDKKASPYVDYKLGASVGGASGFYTALSVGCKIKRFDVSLGYTVQLTELYDEVYHYNSYYGGYYTYDYYTGNVGGLSLKVGVEF